MQLVTLESMKFLNKLIKQTYFSMEQSPTKRCSNCHTVRVCLQTCLYCKSIFYCSIQCREIHFQSIHKNFCNNAPIAFQNNHVQSRKGRVGLQNMNNTCYLNSCIQCLSHTKQLTTYFLNKDYEKQINQKNKYGLKGQFARAYYTCIQNLWVKDKPTYRPSQLKKVIEKKNKEFQSFQQQDASQLFATVIDAIHEDLNRSQKRQNKQMTDIYGKHDSEGAKISWLHYLINNQSIIIDHMTGLFKSAITCPSCKNVSTKFDAFNMINLPIPQDYEIKRLTFYVMYYQKPIRKCQIQFQEINFQKIKKLATRAIRGNHKNYKLYFLSKRSQIQQLQKNFNIQYFHKIFGLYRDRMFLVQLTPEERQITDKFQLTCYFAERLQANKHNNYWYKRPFFIELNSQTGYSLSRTILRFLYIFCYKQRLKSTVFGPVGKQYNKYLQQMMPKANRPFRLLLVRKSKRVDDYFMRDVGYNYQLKLYIQDHNKISQCIEQILKQDDQQNTPMNKKFQLIIEIIDQSKFFEFKTLRNAVQQQSKKEQQRTQKKQIDLYDCFDAFQCQENLTAQFDCINCQQKRKICKRMNIYRSPDILVLVLNRFKLIENGARTKNDQQVKFPMDLDLQKYVIENKPMNSYIEIAKKLIDYKKPLYPFEPNLHVGQKFQLYAVVNHYGKLNSGHYNAYAKNQSKWYLFNDSNVTQVNQIKQKNAYILFYRRKNH